MNAFAFPPRMALAGLWLLLAALVPAAAAQDKATGKVFRAGAHAQDIKYPVDTVTLVTHSSPGGGTDVYLREMIQFLGPVMGAEFAVENVRGGSGAKAIAKVANSPADGSIFYGSTPSYINMSLLSKPEFGHDSVEPLVGIFLDPQVIYVRKDSPLRGRIEQVEIKNPPRGYHVSLCAKSRTLTRRAAAALWELAPATASI